MYYCLPNNSSLASIYVPSARRRSHFRSHHLAPLLPCEAPDASASPTPGGLILHPVATNTVGGVGGRSAENEDERGCGQRKEQWACSRQGGELPSRRGCTGRRQRLNAKLGASLSTERPMVEEGVSSGTKRAGGTWSRLTEEELGDQYQTVVTQVCASDPRLDSLSEQGDADGSSAEDAGEPSRSGEDVVEGDSHGSRATESRLGRRLVTGIYQKREVHGETRRMDALGGRQRGEPARAGASLPSSSLGDPHPVVVRD